MPNQIETLLDTVNQSVNHGIAYFEEEGISSNVRIDLWEPREVLAHLVFWHEFVANALDSNESPAKIYASIDEMNARAIGRAANKSIKSLVIDIKNLNTRLNDSVKRITDTNEIIIIFPNGEGKTAQDILGSLIAKHWDSHISELKN